MKRVLDRMLFFTLGVLFFSACATTWKFYGIEQTDECYDHLKLLGAPGTGGWADEPGSKCRPESGKLGKCVVQFSDDFFKKDTALLQCQRELKECQKGPKPTGG